jgi:uncharacterized membrane protein
MENNSSSFDSFELQITPVAQDFLRTAAGWALFMSIVGFIFLALGLLGALGAMAAGSAMGDMSGGMGMMGLISGMTLGVIILVFVVLLFFPTLFLFKFSSTTKQALNNSNIEGITRAFNNLKNYFMWIGIITILYIVSYIAFIIFVASAATSVAGME